MEQIQGLLSRMLEARAEVPLFVFDAGYDPVKLQRGLEGRRARILLVRLHSNRSFYADPEEEELEPRPVGRPRRHGRKFALPEPETSWPNPCHEYRCRTENYKSVRLRAWTKLHPKTRRIGERYGCERAPVVRGSVILVEVSKLPRETRKPKKLWLWFSDGGEPGGELGREPDWTCCGEPTSGDSTWSTPSACSSRLWVGPRRGCATPSRPTSGRGWSWPPTTPSCVLRARVRRIAGCLGNARSDAGGLTPCRVLRGFATLLAVVATPACPPKPCGRSPGRPKGRLSGRARRYPALKKKTA